MKTNKLVSPCTVTMVSLQHNFSQRTLAAIFCCLDLFVLFKNWIWHYNGKKSSTA